MPEVFPGVSGVKVLKEGLSPTVQPIVHQAALPQDLVQKCSLCGEILIDRRNQMVMDGYELCWYEGGVEKGGSYIATTFDPPNCSRRIG